MQRYRECHDFYHVITGPFPVTTAAELVVKWFELANMGLPVAALSAFFGPLRLNSSLRRRLMSTYVPWALKCGSATKPLISIDWENRWEQPVAQLRSELGVWDPPVSWEAFKLEGRRMKEQAR
jgi:ubiquinone biosynthesis protein COQ4